MGHIAERKCVSKTGERFVIRTAEADDALRLLAYVREVVKESPFFIMEADEFTMTEDEERDWIQDHCDGPGKLLILAEAADKVIGSLGFDNGQRRRLAHRGTFGVSTVDQWRGKGVGTAMLRALIDWAEENPLIEKINLNVFATNTTAMGLYKKLGFVEHGRAPKEVKIGPGQYLDTILMHRFV